MVLVSNESLWMLLQWLLHLTLLISLTASLSCSFSFSLYPSFSFSFCLTLLSLTLFRTHSLPHTDFSLSLFLSLYFFASLSSLVSLSSSLSLSLFLSLSLALLSLCPTLSLTTVLSLLPGHFFLTSSRLFSTNVHFQYPPLMPPARVCVCEVPLIIKEHLCLIRQLWGWFLLFKNNEGVLTVCDDIKRRQ